MGHVYTTFYRSTSFLRFPRFNDSDRSVDMFWPFLSFVAIPAAPYGKLFVLTYTFTFAKSTWSDVSPSSGHTSLVTTASSGFDYCIQILPRLIHPPRAYESEDSKLPFKLMARPLAGPNTLSPYVSLCPKSGYLMSGVLSMDLVISQTV